ncbi:cell division protein FtsQ/DivIB [Deinococcus misasensis]|uniref:cell division protein FtsQ/DivIB n=1 Tax=Deinococcus misasensis TaxID=392413 RepID=UPI00069057A3|nr:FtsQ-type POTRA domain-containing protein [Deinococcus misasensis]
MGIIRLLVVMLISVTLLVASWFILPVRKTEISGLRHLKNEEVVKLVHGKPGDPWLWIARFRLKALENHPWILSASVVKTFPSDVKVSIVERVPVARLLKEGHEVVLSADGVELPGAPRVGPLIKTEGKLNIQQALEVAFLLRSEGVQVVELTPAGIRMKLGDSTVWADSVDSLRKYMSSVKMKRGKNIHIYPWGVSVQ